jgi:hypothetical protein
MYHSGFIVIGTIFGQIERSAHLVAFSHLQASQIRGRQPYLFVRKIPYVIPCGVPEESGQDTLMAEIKAGAPFGVDGAMLATIDWNLALTRVSHDLRTDFIYAPHLGFIYSRAGDELITKVKSDLKSGQYTAGLPLTIEVPKSFRIRVAVPSKRLGPAFSRPGSIQTAQPANLKETPASSRRSPTAQRSILR